LADLDGERRAVAAKYGLSVITATPALEREAGVFALSASAAREASDVLPEPNDVALLLHRPGTTSRPNLVPTVLQSTKTQPGARRTDVDALRILICAAIILSHALLIFGADPNYHLKSAVPSRSASFVFDFVRANSVSLFFVIAGWSAVASLRRRSSSQFVMERMTRLLVPLFVGMALFGSIIKYVELSHGIDMGLRGLQHIKPLNESFFKFFPHNLTMLRQITWSHLWFLAYLFLYTVFLLPLLVRLARCAPRAVEPAALTVYLPAIPMALLLVATKGYWPFLPNLITDWPNCSFYALCFVIGAGIAVWPGFEARLSKEAPRLFAFMVLAFAGMTYTGESAAGRLFVALTMWGGIGAGFGFASRFKPAATPALTYLTEATMPVFIVHHAPLLLLGVLLLPMALPVWLKIVSIWIVATAISLAAYHWLIRPWPLVRWSMGMASNPAITRGVPAPR
jgi:glucans biosynthesis protein C